MFPQTACCTTTMGCHSTHTDIGLTWQRSASSHTRKASFPPSSSTTGVKLEAAACIQQVTDLSIF